MFECNIDLYLCEVQVYCGGTNITAIALMLWCVFMWTAEQTDELLGRPDGHEPFDGPLIGRPDGHDFPVEEGDDSLCAIIRHVGLC